MTTDPKNTSIRSGLSIHPEQRASNTSPKAVANREASSEQTRAIPGNVVIHGDCVEELGRLRSGSIDMILTDPPYLVNYKDLQGQRILNDDNDRWLIPAFKELYRVLKPNSYCVSFYGWPKADRFLAAWRACGFYPVGHIVLVKSYTAHRKFTQSRHEQAYVLAKGRPTLPATPPPDVLPFPYTANRQHPAEKPVEGLKPLIEAFSKPGETVLDPFAGSGSTGVAAKTLGRKYLLIERDEPHYRTCRERLRQ